MHITAQSVFSDLEKIRAQAPLIHNITNFVVMQQTANALLALGASPIMAHAEEELCDMVQLVNALVINIGTLDSQWLKSMEIAINAAQQRGIPIILDPVGSGATPLRTQAARSLIKKFPSLIIRGNASEIMSLLSDEQKTKGVDSMHSTDQAVHAAKQLVPHLVVISGACDIILNQQHQIHIHNGTALMTRVTGMGCTATTFIAAFCAVNPNYLQACAHAMAIMGIAGEITTEQVNGPGGFQIKFLDIVYNLNEKDIAAKLKVNHV